MLDPETFLVELYVPVDEFCEEHLPRNHAPVPPPEARWVAQHHAQVVAPTQDGSDRAWLPRKRRETAGWRQVVETAVDHLLVAFQLERDRQHELDGFQARLAAKVALHNFCLWLNRRLGQPALAYAELLGWLGDHPIPTKR